MSQFFELHYHLPEDPARLFDVAQGLAGRRSVLKRGGTVKVKPFTETCRRLLFQCIAFAVLTALAAVLVWAFHAKLKVLFFLCLVMSLVTFSSRFSARGWMAGQSLMLGPSLSRAS